MEQMEGGEVGVFGGVFGVNTGLVTVSEAGTGRYIGGFLRILSGGVL